MTSPEKILVIGGTGFIGRALVYRLVAEGHDVDVLSRTGWRETVFPAGATTHQADQSDAEKLAPLLEKCRQVFHLAATTTPADTIRHPAREAEQNLLPTLRFLECAQNFPDNRYFFLSTGGALYGDASRATEDTLPRPTSYHGACKLALEQFFSVLGQRHPGRLTILRPSNVYGPEQPLRQGFGVIPTLLERVRDGGRLTVFGDGSATRDYLYIDDLVDACLRAMAGPAGTYNLGSGKGHSLNQLLDMIGHMTGKPLRIDYLPARVSDVQHIVLDTHHARKYLGWQPRVDLLDGLQRCWRGGE